VLFSLSAIQDECPLEKKEAKQTKLGHLHIFLSQRSYNEDTAGLLSNCRIWVETVLIDQHSSFVPNDDSRTDTAAFSFAQLFPKKETKPAYDLIYKKS